jgi:hypothetical protein
MDSQDELVAGSNRLLRDAAIAAELKTGIERPAPDAGMCRPATANH